MPTATLPARQRGSTAPTGNRGKPRTVTMRATTLLVPLMEGISLADEAIAAAARIHDAAIAGSRMRVVHLAGQLSVRAQASRAELRALAAEVDR